MSAQRGQPVSPQMFVELQQALLQQREELLVSRQRTAALEARLALSERGVRPRMPIEFRSQYGEDLWIWDIFGQQTEGFYIEAGAFDGYHFSVTYGLEAMGWTGLLVEALPEHFKKCVERRPHSRVVHSALGRRGASGTTEFVSVQDQFGGMLSFVQSSSEHSRMITQQRYSTKSFSVPMTSLDALLTEHDGPIDAVVLDVEGGELDALDGFNLDRYKPRALIIEDNQMGRDPAVSNFMSSKPYVFAGWLSVNRLYLRADEERLLTRLRRF